MSTAPTPARDRGTSISVVSPARSSRFGTPPTPLTPLIGRQHERARVAGLIRDGVRLVTLTGPGGVGKSRLALQLAIDLRSHFVDGLAWVPLAAVRDANAVMPTIARALGVQSSPDLDLLGAVKIALQDARLLLLLDNVEQVLPAMAQLTDMLRACPRLVILSTSRSLLRVSGEHAVRVPPLEAPPSSGPYVELVGGEAVQLFSERARAVSPDFTLDVEDARIVADICGRLDGIPLAIELAAARVSFLPLPALSARLERRLPLLSDGALDQPPRLRTMRDAIAWSYDLLSPPEQAVFRGVAIHAGGFRLDAAIPLTASPPSPESEVAPELISGALNCIRALTDQSLLHQEADPDGEPRFVMLETIREFALEELQASGEREATERARAAYLTGLVDRYLPTPLAPGNDLSLAILEAEQANIRECLAWLIKDGDEDRAFRLAGAFAHVWIARGYYQQGRSLLDQLLSHRERAADRAEALVGLGYMLMFQGESEQARTVLEDALQLCQPLANPALPTMALTGLGVVAGQQTRYADGMELLYEALSPREGPDNPRQQVTSVHGSAHSALGTMAHGLGKLALAQDHHTRSLTLRRKLGDTRGMSRALADLGSVAVDQGDHERALEHFREALTLAAEYRNPPFVSHALVGAAHIALAREQPVRAARLLGAADRLRGDIEAVVTLEFEHLARKRARASVRVALGDEGLTGAMVEGSACSLNDIISEIDRITPLPDATSPDSPIAVERYGLTSRELDVLRGIVDYLTDREIAERLFISRRTVGWHVTGILNKLGVDSRRQAAMKTVDEGLI